MNRTAISTLLILSALLASAPAEGQIRLDSDRQRRLLRVMDRAKGCPEEATLRAMGAGIDSTLVNLLYSKESPMRYRLYAVDCLGYFNNKRSLQVLSSLLGDPTWDKVYRHRAFFAAAKAMGAEAFEELKEACNDRDAETRAAAARAMGWIQVPRARALLLHLRLREREPEVQEAIDESLKRIPQNPLRHPETGF